MSKRGRYVPEDLIASENLPTVKGRCVLPSRQMDNPTVATQWMKDLHNPEKPKVIDLFCGAGGMSEGFVNAGFVVAAAFDIDEMACRTFEANIPAKVICTDIENIADPIAVLDGLPVSSISVVIGGPPCQGFSNVGRARIQSLDEANQRQLLAKNELYQHFFRFVEAYTPAYFVMENVPTLENFENGAYIKAIRESSRQLGYEIISEKLNAVDFGVPQKRRRLIIVGSRIGHHFLWPRTINENDRVTLAQAISDLPSVKPPSLEEELDYCMPSQVSDYQRYMRSRVKPEERNVIRDHIVRPARQDDIDIFSNMKPGQKYTDIPPLYRRYNADSFKDKYYMLKPDTPCVTITAHLAKDGYRYIHYDSTQHRTLSVREAARIQSFGDHYRFAGYRSSRYRQIGNAVPPLLAQHIAEQVKRGMRRAQIMPMDGDLYQFALPTIGSTKIINSTE